jgi:hypothetical protein
MRLNSLLVGGRGHYLNRSAKFEASVLGVIRAYTVGLLMAGVPGANSRERLDLNPFPSSASTWMS